MRGNGLEEKIVWKTPELIVLVRSKPEEAVLATCKNQILLDRWPTKLDVKVKLIVMVDPDWMAVNPSF